MNKERLYWAGAGSMVHPKSKKPLMYGDEIPELDPKTKKSLMDKGLVVTEKPDITKTTGGNASFAVARSRIRTLEAEIAVLKGEKETLLDKARASNEELLHELGKATANIDAIAAERDALVVERDALQEQLAEVLKQLEAAQTGKGKGKGGDKS